MKVIKQLFKSLEKQGLLKGRLHVHNRIFIYDSELGIREEPTEKSQTQREVSRDGIEIPVAVKKPKPTIRRGAESPERGVSRKEEPKKKSKETSLLPKLLIPLLLLVVVLLVAIITINRNLSQSEPDPAAVSETEAGEQLDMVADSNTPVVDESVDSKNEQKADQTEAQQNRRYDLYLSRTRTCISEKKYEQARIALTRAKTYAGDDLKEIRILEAELKDLSSGPKKTVDEKPAPSKPAPYRSTITIREIPDTLSHQYSQQMKTLRVDLPRKTNVSGYLSLNIFISESGKLFLADSNETALKIDPDSKKKKVMRNLREMINGLKLPVPVDQEGRAVKVGNWRLNYLVTQFKRRMILRKQ